MLYSTLCTMCLVPSLLRASARPVLFPSPNKVVTTSDSERLQLFAGHFRSWLGKKPLSWTLVSHGSTHLTCFLFYIHYITCMPLGYNFVTQAQKVSNSQVSEPCNAVADKASSTEDDTLLSTSQFDMIVSRVGEFLTGNLSCGEEKTR